MARIALDLDSGGARLQIGEVTAVDVTIDIIEGNVGERLPGLRLTIDGLGRLGHLKQCVLIYRTAEAVGVS